MTPIVTYQDGKRYFAAVAGGAVLAYAQPRNAVVAKIVAAGFSRKEAERMLDAPVTPAEWRATWASALTHDLAGIGDDLAAIEDRARADAIESRLAQAAEMLADVQAQNAELLRVEEERTHAAEAERVARDRITQQRAAQEKQKQVTAAKHAEAAKWVDVRVIQVGDAIEVWRDTVEFVQFVGPNYEPEFRRYSTRLASYSVSDAPADVRARVGVAPARSKVYVPPNPREKVGI